MVYQPPHVSDDRTSVDAAVPKPPAMGDHCTNSPPLDASESSSGEIVKLGETEIYVSKPYDAELREASLLVLLTNGVGIYSANNQVQADHFAKEGYFVVMPDLFSGDPAPKSANVAAAVPEKQELGLLDQIKMKAVEGVKGFMIDMWIARHTPENTMPIIEKVLKAVGEQYGDKQYKVARGIYVVGYCFGGKYALRLAARDDVKAVAMAHGTMVDLEDIKGVKKPVTFACVENDPFFPDEIREEGEKFLEDNKLEYELLVYKDVPHGFGVYGSYPDPLIKDAQEGVFEQFVQFLSRH